MRLFFVSKPKKKLTLNQVQAAQKFTRYIQGLALGTYNTPKHKQMMCSFGHPEAGTVDPITYYNVSRYDAVARCVVSKIPNICHKSPAVFIEGEEDSRSDTPTTLENSMDELLKRLNFWDTFKDLDIENRRGRYAGLIIQIQNMNDEPENVISNWETPLGEVNANQIIRLIPANEIQLQVSEQEWNQSSPRYGQPITYTYNESSATSADRGYKTATIHYTRVIPLSEGSQGDSLWGLPSIEPIYNDILDLYKIAGAGGEGFYKASGMRMVMGTSEGSQMPSAEEMQQIDEVVDNFNEGFDPALFAGGFKPTLLNFNPTSPAPFAEITKQRIAAGSGIPQNEIFGSQTGVLAGDKDTSGLLRDCQSRRETLLTRFLDAFVDWLFAHGAAKETKYNWVWDDLMAPSNMDKAELGLKKAEAINKLNEALMKGADVPDEAIEEIYGDLGVSNTAGAGEIDEAVLADDKSSTEGVAPEKDNVSSN